MRRIVWLLLIPVVLARAIAPSANGAEPAKAVEQSESDEKTEELTVPPSWRSFDEWLSRAGLKLSNEQEAQLKLLRKEMEQQSGVSSETSANQPEKSERSEEPLAPSASHQELWNQYQQGLATILTPEQQQRLRKQWYQFRGMTVLADADVAEKLKLTEGQRKEVHSVMESYRSDRTEATQSTRKLGRTGRQRRRQIVSELREKRDTRLEKLMTADQKEAFKKLGDSAESSESLPLPTLIDDFIDLGPAQKTPPREQSPPPQK